MPAATITIASLSGLAAGIACTIAAVHGIDTGTFEGIVLLTAVRLFPAICITLVSMTAFRAWIARHETRTRAEYTNLAEQRAKFSEECQRRTAELDAREQRIMRMAESASVQFMCLTDRLNEALHSLMLSRRELAELQAEYDELATDHNQVIRETLQERANTFSRRGRASGPRPPLPARAGRSPAPPPVRLRLPMYQLPDQSRHDRAAEDVGGHA
ncbi:hypothetical protein ACFWH1_18850 [Streptomyces sp. NPDC127037]|uniref:hypothetical protein n=1 Tax=Streptomyces sp. NPDC127037 TaxID=3347113 RepID=UPI0036472895